MTNRIVSADGDLSVMASFIKRQLGFGSALQETAPGIGRGDYAATGVGTAIVIVARDLERLRFSQDRFYRSKLSG
jgi:hypothetical protein